MLSSPAQSALLKPPSTQATAKPAKDPVVNAKDFQLPEVILVSDPPKQQGPSDPPDPTVAVVASYSHGNFQSSLSLSHSIIASHIPGPNSANDLQHDNPILTLPSDMVYEILGKIPAPALDCSNPFSIPEHCTLAEPTASTSRSMNLIAAQSNIKATTSSPQALQTVTVPTSKSVNSASSLTDISCLPSNIPLNGNTANVIPQEANLVVDLSPFKVKVKRKSKNKGSTSYDPKTRSSKGPPPPLCCSMIKVLY